MNRTPVVFWVLLGAEERTANIKSISTEFTVYMHLYSDYQPGKGERTFIV